MTSSLSLSDNAKMVLDAFVREVELEFSIGPCGSDVLPQHRHTVDIGESLKFNAFVRLDKRNEPCYKFNAGCAFAINDAMMSAVSQPDFYKEFSTSEEMIRGPEVPGRFRDYSWLAGDSEQGPAVYHCRYMTFDRLRWSLGDHLWELAIRFVILHEIMHFMLGHLHYIRDKTGMLFIKEVTDHDVQSSRLETMRVIELAADLSALSILLHTGRRPEERRAAHFKHIDNELIWDRTVLTAVSIVFMLVELNERQTLPSFDLRTHPSSAARTVNAFSFYQHFIGAHNRLSEILNMQSILHDMAVAARIAGVLPMTATDFLESTFITEKLDSDSPVKEVDDLMHTRKTIDDELGVFQQDVQKRLGIEMSGLEEGEIDEGAELYPKDIAFRLPISYLNESRRPRPKRRKP